MVRAQQFSRRTAVKCLESKLEGGETDFNVIKIGSNGRIISYCDIPLPEKSFKKCCLMQGRLTIVDGKYRFTCHILEFIHDIKTDISTKNYSVESINNRMLDSCSLIFYKKKKEK